MLGIAIGAHHQQLQLLRAPPLLAGAQAVVYAQQNRPGGGVKVNNWHRNTLLKGAMAGMPGA